MGGRLGDINVVERERVFFNEGWVASGNGWSAQESGAEKPFSTREIHSEDKLRLVCEEMMVPS